MSVALLPLRGGDCYLVRSDACPSFRFNSSLGRLPGLVNHRGSDGRIGKRVNQNEAAGCAVATVGIKEKRLVGLDRKSTRLNSSHQIISYAVFCLKKKNN